MSKRSALVKVNPHAKGTSHMKVFTEYLKFHTKTHRAYVHITPQIEAIVDNSGIKEGMVLVSA
ncbi:MAG: hypothetical protein WCC37_08485, partial [Candidatus Sulfotelmatobacter sp.]